MTDNLPAMIEGRLEREMQIEADRVEAMGAFYDWLTQPTPAMSWLERAAANLEAQRDPDGAKKRTRDKLVIDVMERDGNDCWFCGRPLAGDVTLEHLQPLALGGNWSLGNLALAHRGCNKAAGHLTRIKKEALREERLVAVPSSIVGEK